MSVSDHLPRSVKNDLGYIDEDNSGEDDEDEFGGESGYHEISIRNVSAESDDVSEVTEDSEGKLQIANMCHHNETDTGFRGNEGHVHHEKYLRAVQLVPRRMSLLSNNLDNGDGVDRGSSHAPLMKKEKRSSITSSCAHVKRTGPGGTSRSKHDNNRAKATSPAHPSGIDDGTKRFNVKGERTAILKPSRKLGPRNTVVANVA